jgi:hypothetical protein
LDEAVQRAETIRLKCGEKFEVEEKPVGKTMRRSGCQLEEMKVWGSCGEVLSEFRDDLRGWKLSIVYAYKITSVSASEHRNSIRTGQLESKDFHRSSSILPRNHLKPYKNQCDLPINPQRYSPNTFTSHIPKLSKTKCPCLPIKTLTTFPLFPTGQIISF